MDTQRLLDFLSQAEQLKHRTRHNIGKDGRRESVAEHCWRAALMALLLEPEHPEIDCRRVMELCLVHDLGEAITGDIPTFRKTEEDEQREERAVEQLLELLEPAQRKRLTELFEELEEGTTAEARLMTAIDKAEAVLSHNEAPISTWEDHEYQLQRTHGIREAAAASPAMAELRQAILEQTEDKIRKEGCGHV